MLSSFIAKPSTKSLIGLLATLWLVGQLMTAFHVGHDEVEAGIAHEHSCVLCKVANVDDAILTTLVVFAFLRLVFSASSTLHAGFAQTCFAGYQSRAPPLN